MTQGYKHFADFKEIGSKGIKKLQGMTVTVVGLGGIGSICAEILTRAKIPIRIIDRDRVKLDDIDRQGLYTEADIGKFKANQAKKILKNLNKDANIKGFNEEISEDTLFMVDASLVIDASSDPKLNAFIWEYCKKKKMGYICVYHRGSKGAVQVFTPSSTFDDLERFIKQKEEGFINTVSYATAALAVSQAYKQLLGKKTQKGFFVFDLWEATTEKK